MNEYVGLNVGEVHQSTETSEYYCARCGYPVTDHDGYCRECGGAFQSCLADEPCDHGELIELADELESMKYGPVGVVIAGRIREALGIKDG